MHTTLTQAGRGLVAFLHNGYRLSDHENQWGRAVTLCNTILLTVVIVTAVFAVLNLWVFDLPQIAMVDMAMCSIAIAMLVFFHRSDNIKITAWVTVLVVVAGDVAFLLMIKHRYYALFWLMAIPVTAISLIGARAGGLLSIVVLGGMFGWLYLGLSRWDSAQFSSEALSNIVIATLFLTAVLWYVQRGLEKAMAVAARQNRALRQQSTTDYLTGIHNRQAMEEHLNHCLKSARPEMVVALVDLDNFKTINDRLGHTSGDAALKAAAELLVSHTGEQTRVGRWGGDEFLLISSQNTERLQADILHAGEALAARFQITSERLSRLGLSAGLTTCQPGDQLESVLARVDAGLHQAKSKGKGRVERVAAAY